MEERIQKLLSAAGICSRRTAEHWITQGRVTVNGLTAHLGDRADRDRDQVQVDGRPIRSQPERVYLMLNKPRGYVTTLSDEKGRQTVAELVSGCGTRVYPVGRLDLNSEGLLLMTNDGEWMQHLLHPSHEVEKTYHVRIAGDVRNAAWRLRQVRELEEKIAAAQRRQAACGQERRTFQIAADYYKTRADKYAVLGKLPQSANTFLISGYVPMREGQAFAKKLEADFAVSAELEEPDPDADVPVLQIILHRGAGRVEPVDAVAVCPEGAAGQLQGAVHMRQGKGRVRKGRDAGDEGEAPALEVGDDIVHRRIVEVRRLRAGDLRRVIELPAGAPQVQHDAAGFLQRLQRRLDAFQIAAQHLPRDVIARDALRRPGGGVVDVMDLDLLPRRGIAAIGLGQGDLLRCFGKIKRHAVAMVDDESLHIDKIQPPQQQQDEQNHADRLRGLLHADFIAIG